MDKTIIVSTLMLGLVGLLALNIKQIFTWGWTVIVDRLFHSLVVEESSRFFYAIQSFITMEQNHKIQNYYYKNIYDTFIDGDGRDIKLFYNRGFIFLKTMSGQLLISKENAVIANTQTPYKNTKQSFKIYSWNRSVINEFIEHVTARYVDNNIRYYFNNNGDIMVYGNIVKKTFDNIFLNPGLKERILTDLDKFNNARPMYEKLGMKYKRTYMFHGGAGSGKSSIAIAMANYLKRDILTINMSKDMTDSTLISLIAKRPAKAIVLFEDIDCLFEELNRTPAQDEKEKTPLMKITLSCVLNILDGSFTPEDVIFIITTNHIDKLDPALKRDGRVNVKMEIDKPTKATKRAYIHYLAEHNTSFNPNTVNLEEDVSISTLEQNLF